MQRPYKKTFIVICALLLILILANFIFSIPYYSLDAVEFQNLDRLQLSARYSESKNGEGVLIATDITHDKSELTAIVYELTKAGYGVYIFDFPSHGNSAGSLPFHLNTGSYLAEQFYCAAVSYSQLENISIENIHVIAYGQGARAALQTASLGFITPKSITLVGCALNLSGKTQYDFLNYSVDNTLSWVENINGYTGGCEYHLISSSMDNVSTNEDNINLMQKLSDTSIAVNANSNTVTHTTVRGVSHSQLMSSNKVTKAIINKITEISDISYTYNNISFIKNILKYSIYALVFAASYVFYLMIREKTTNTATASDAKLNAFIWIKLIFWLPNLILMCLIPLVLYLLPISYPYNDILKATLLISYGILMLIVYKFTNFDNNTGKSFFRKEQDTYKYAGIIILAAYCILFSLISLSGISSIFAVKSRWPWIIIFTLLCGVIFFIDEKERKIKCRNIKDNIKLICVNYLGCIIAPIFMLILGLSDTFLELCGMFIFIILLLIIEKILNCFKSPTGINAAVKAFLFQLIILSHGAMWIK